MKKLLTIAALLGVASLSYGQGYVGFANGTGSRVFTTNGPGSGVGGTMPAYTTGNYYMFELLVAPTTQTTIGGALAGWTDTGDFATNTTAGRLQPGVASPDSPANGVQVNFPGFSPGTGTADFAVVGWSQNIATTYAGFLAWYAGGLENGPTSGNGSGGTEYSGISGVALNVVAAPSGGPYGGVWGPASSGYIQGMTLTGQVPEPTTFALAGLGAAALVIFRRRKV